MRVTVNSNTNSNSLLLREPKETGISRLKEIEIINLSKTDINHFQPLYEAYHPIILNYVYQKIGEKNMAADITSHVFVKVMMNLKRYKIQSVPFSAWLYKIAYNETMLFFRKSKSMRLVVLDDALLNGIEAELKDFSKEEVLNSLETVLSNLKPAQFELIELRFYQGKSFQEIGYILGCSENTAKVRSHRLLKRMKVELLKRNPA